MYRKKRICKCCGKEIVNRSKHAKYCEECAELMQKTKHERLKDKKKYQKKLETFKYS